jgi:hypothetical protein
MRGKGKREALVSSPLGRDKADNAVMNFAAASDFARRQEAVMNFARRKQS